MSFADDSYKLENKATSEKAYDVSNQEIALDQETNLTQKAKLSQKADSNQESSLNKEEVSQKSLKKQSSQEGKKREQEELKLEELEPLEGLSPLDSNLRNKLSNFDLLWRTAFEIKVFDDNKRKSGVVSTKIYGDFKWDLMEQFSIQGELLLNGRNGFTQSVFDRKDRAGGLHLLESFFQWRPKNSPISFNFGNIKQDFLQAPLLMTDRTFPSFIFNYSLKEFYNFKPSFLIQASIPDNADESVIRDAQIIKGFPFFSVASFYLENSKLPLHQEHFFFNRLVFFHYYNLSQAVSKRSAIYENTVDSQNSENDESFRYDYYGFHNHSNFKLVLSHFFAGEVGLEYINNLGAPYHINEGFRLYTGLSYNYRDFLEWNILFETFINQSDSSVAFYNSEFYGHNKRKGFAIHLESYFYDSGLRSGTSFVHSKPIDESNIRAIGPSYSISVFLTTNQIKI